MAVETQLMPPTKPNLRNCDSNPYRDGIRPPATRATFSTCTIGGESAFRG